MRSKVVAAHIAPVVITVPAASLPAGTLVRIPFVTGNPFGLITGNLSRSVDLVNLSDQQSWSDLKPGNDNWMLVEPLPVGSQIVLEAVAEEVTVAPVAEPQKEEEEETDDWGWDNWDWDDED